MWMEEGNSQESVLFNHSLWVKAQVIIEKTWPDYSIELELPKEFPRVVCS